MAELTCFSSLMELEIIQRRYEGRVKNLFFKLVFRDSGYMAYNYDAVVEKVWLLGSHGQVWWYEIYGDNRISPLYTHLIFEGDMIWLSQFLDTGFDEKHISHHIRGEGFEMVRYHKNGKVRHRICGEISNDPYLCEVVERVETYVMREWRRVIKV
ncbi:MAG: hypothetical protein IKU25_03490 [Clostridia bacterium]|nr:hypothetical protein [Clostridia bacterium]